MLIYKAFYKPSALQLNMIEKKNSQKLKAKFLKIFANLPDTIRSEDLVAVVDDKPYTWNSAAIEVKNETPTGIKILSKLDRNSTAAVQGKRMSREIKKLALWKLELEAPSNLKLSIGSEGSYTKEELKNHIEKEDKIGIMYADVQLQFMRDVTSGYFSKTLAE